ncbi:MAG: GGDEF domain-containing protein [Candidatus Acidiferrales bacterium]
MSVQTSPFVSSTADAEEVKEPRTAPASHRKMIAFKPRRSVAEKDLEGTLLSAVIAADKELGHVLHDLDEISSALKSGKPDAEVLRVAVHPAVWYAVKHALLERELSHLALCDDLTALYNRRGFFAAATHQLKMARRNQKPAVLLFCDLDGLKAINDSFGHREGDLAIVRAADALEEVFRDSDILARISGDEFAVLAMDLPPRHQQTVMARLQKCLNKVSRDETRYELSLSVGAAWFDPQRPVGLGDLMEEADCAMYERKRGRSSPARKETPTLRREPVAGRLEFAGLAQEKA